MEINYLYWVKLYASQADALKRGKFATLSITTFLAAQTGVK